MRGKIEPQKLSHRNSCNPGFFLIGIIDFFLYGTANHQPNSSPHSHNRCHNRHHLVQKSKLTIAYGSAVTVDNCNHHSIEAV
jgi:hypothetical protein